MPIPHKDLLAQTAKEISTFGRPRPRDGVNRLGEQDHDAQALDSFDDPVLSVKAGPAPDEGTDEVAGASRPGGADSLGQQTREARR